MSGQDSIRANEEPLSDFDRSVVGGGRRITIYPEPAFLAHQIRKLEDLVLRLRSIDRDTDRRYTTRQRMFDVTSAVMACAKEIKDACAGARPHQSADPFTKGQ